MELEISKVQQRAMQGRQVRYVDIKAGQLRAEDVGEGDKVEKFIRGYAILWGSIAKPYRGWPDYKEVIARDALDGVDLSDCRLLVNHDMNLVLGRAGKNLTLTIDDIGLYVEAKVHSGVQFAKDYYNLLKAEFIDGMSFAFSIDKWAYDKDADVYRITKIGDVWEVSLVTFPAYEETVAIAREKRAAMGLEPAASENASNGNERGAGATPAGMGLEPGQERAKEIPQAQAKPDPADAQERAKLWAELEALIGGKGNNA